MKNKIYLLLLLLFGALEAAAYNYASADTAYSKGNYEEAALIYSQALEKEGVSAGLLYNLGNTYYRLGKDGEAMLCYERAKRIEPSNSLINQNLNFLRNKVIDANKGALQGKAINVEPDHESFIEGLYRIIAVERKSNSWAVFAVMAFILFLGGMALYMFTPNVLARKTGFFSGLTFLGFTVVFLIFAFLAANNFNRQDEVILINFTTELLDQPREDASSTTTPLHKGTKLKILETKAGGDGTEWLKVKLNADNVGWVKKEGIEVI